VGLAWWQTVADANRMSCTLDGIVKAGRAMPLDAGPVTFAGMWGTMIVAMMLPGIMPAVAGWRDEKLPYPLAGAALTAGYLAVWLPTAVIGLVALTAVGEVGQPSPWLDRVGGAIIALAGAYQLTNWKRRLLGGYGHRGQTESAAGAFGAGVSHGVRCLGSEFALMSVLLVVGLMNVVWMAAIGVVCLGEKTLTRRVTLATGVGVTLLAVGLVVLAHPRALDAISHIG
jgi:predicted metal-binding membrane protein